MKTAIALILLVCCSIVRADPPGGNATYTIVTSGLTGSPLTLVLDWADGSGLYHHSVMGADIGYEGIESFYEVYDVNAFEEDGVGYVEYVDDLWGGYVQFSNVGGLFRSEGWSVSDISDPSTFDEDGFAGSYSSYFVGGSVPEPAALPMIAALSSFLPDAVDAALASAADFVIPALGIALMFVIIGTFVWMVNRGSGRSWRKALAEK